MDIEVHPFLDNEYVVIAPQSHWGVGKRLSLQKLAAEAFLLRELGSGSRHAVDRHMQESSIQLNVRLSLASNEAIRDLVACGMGLAILSRHALGEDFERRGLAELKVSGFPLRQPWSVVRLRSKPLSLPAQAFLDELLRTEGQLRR
jgi:DNA-binding transcriptional LysR family regulator